MSASAAPTLPLARLVEDVRAVVPRTGQPFAQLPDGRTKLVFRVMAGGGGDVAVSGPRTRAAFKEVSGVARALVLAFKPGWSAPALGVGPAALTDQVVLLEALWGSAGAALAEDLLAADGLPDVLARLAEALARRTEGASESSSARLARRAARLLERGEETQVTQVAARLGVTPRHLRRAFTESVGVPPKAFARASRLQRAVRMAADSSDWGRIAVEAGYYDQAHLISDFRDLVGLTPGAFLRRGSHRGERLAPASLGAPR